jgi:3-methylfumaryl-CoA hydratase
MSVELDRYDSDVDVVSSATALAMHGLFNSVGPAPTTGDALPALWHWLAFLPRVPQGELGPDGHPRRNAATRLEEYPQRMFAGARVSFPGVARIDYPLTRKSRVVSQIEKSGRSGPLLFVTVENKIECEGELAIIETQDIVYRSLSGPVENDSDEISVIPESEWLWKMDLSLEPTLLFRYSALTYNAHRIHYDRQYAMNEEGYPGLVVQGPLQALGLLEVVRRSTPDSLVSKFEFRSMRPVFDGGTLHLRALPISSKVDLAAYDNLGRRTMAASAEFS